MSKTLGQTLKEARTMRRLTQLQVAEHIGVTRAAVGQWEATGQISTENLIRVCAFLGIEVQSAVNGIVKPDLSQGNIDTYKRRLSDAVARLERFTPKMDLAVRTLQNPIENSSEGKPHPVYLVRDTDREYFNIQISNKPYMTVRRDTSTLGIWKLYMLALGSDVLEPRLESKKFVYVSLDVFPEIDSIVLVLPMQKQDSHDAGLFDPIKFTDAWIGVLAAIEPTHVSVRQLNPERTYDIPLEAIAVMHLVIPDL